MTDLGGGYQPQGAQPWQPGDPGYDGYAQGQQGYPQQQMPQQVQYGQQPQPQQVQPQQPQQAGGYGYAQGQQGYPQQQMPQQVQYGQPRQPQQMQPQQMQYGQQPYQQQPGQGQPFQQQGHPQQQGFQQQVPYQQQPFQQQAPPPQQQMPQQQMPQQVPPPQGGQPQPPVNRRRRSEPVSGPGPDGIDWEAEAAALESPAAAESVAEPEPEEWTEDRYEESDEEAESFFGEPDDSRSAEKRRKEKGKKAGRKNSGACLVVALVLLGATGGAGWWGYGFYQKHFGPPPDFTGDGKGTVQVEIKPGPGEAMGKTLKDAGVVKSIDAFTAAFNKNPKAGGIQPGFFTMHHEMSGEAAVKMLVESLGGAAIIFPEGRKATDTYKLIDEKLKQAPGTTAGVAQSKLGELGLPAYANNNLEGFLWPTKYPISEGMKPEDLLKQMVKTAADKYQELGLDASAQKAGYKNGYEVVIAASILQAEGNNSADFGKIARVISNRLNTPATQGKLQLDTTLQYKLGRTKFTKAEKDGDKSPYNTYVNKGLPPAPISNPGEDAIKAVLDPTPGDWVYFVALTPQETRFAATFDAFKKDVKEYCKINGQGFNETEGMCA
ncbi:endolytic transglycosylase MltG [Kitasatospora sp. NPDC096147]|uniref:endolytic transglycosylase MltG n=1 Tax=Kitasatospora sp. NPDC096147 TaxID=3364093 RepID=UPI00380A1DFB